MFNESDNENKNKGIRDFLWTIRAGQDAIRSGRIVSFGHGRNSTFVPDNHVEIDMEEVRKGLDNNDQDLKTN